jgi:hypothetical protein
MLGKKKGQELLFYLYAQVKLLGKKPSLKLSQLSREARKATPREFITYYLQNPEKARHSKQILSL